MDGFKIEPDYADAYQTWKKKPGKSTMGPLLKQVQPAIDKGIAANAGRNASPVLRSSARKLAIDAVRSYDPKRSQLSTHVINHMRGLRRLNRQQQQILRIPERVVLDQRFLTTAEAELEDRLGRDPSTSELADHTGLSLKRIGKVRSYRHPAYEGSLLSTQAGDEKGGFLPSVEHDREDYVIRAVYDDLDETNQQIVERTLGLYGKTKLSNAQIASKLRMTPGAVSQRKAHIQQLIDQMTELGT